MRASTPLRSTDWLKEMSGILMFGLGLAVLGVIGRSVAAVGIGAPVEVPGDDVAKSVTLTGLNAGVVLDRSAPVNVTVEDPTAGQITLSLFTWLPTAAVVIAMLAILLRIVRAARREPFTDATVRRLYRLGWVIILGGPAAWLCESFARFALVGTVSTGGPAAVLTFERPMTWVLVGFGYLAIAQLVTRGAALRTELDEVI